MAGLAKYAGMRWIDSVRSSLAIVMYSWTVVPLTIRDASLGRTYKCHHGGRDCSGSVYATMKTQLCNCGALLALVCMYIMDACFYGMSTGGLSYRYLRLLLLQR